MSEDHERVEPAPFDAAPTTESKPAQPPQNKPSAWVLPALGGLAVLAMLVVFWLPGRIASPPAEREAEEVVTTTNTPEPSRKPAASAPAAERSPYAEAQSARLRTEAQEILAELLDSREQLLNRGVELWAPEGLASVDELAAVGDELYREREFETAIARYREALDQAIALEGRLPAVLEEQLLIAANAIESGEVDAARDAVALAEKLDPGLGRTAELRARVEKLPTVVEELAAAAQAEASNDLGAAKRALEQATGADPAHQRAAAELARVSAALTRQQFASAMSDGYAALDDEAFAKARQAFKRADQLTPGSAEAAAGIAEVAIAETAAKLRTLRRKAEEQVGAEDWSAAVESYEAAMTLDASVLFAQRGLDTARRRAQLDEKLVQALDDPDRLSDPKVADAVAQLLALARGVASPGPRLEGQIKDLAATLTRANTEVSVTLLSDGATDVRVNRVARLGSFSRQTLDLRPGEYTAVGTRPGFRDVRKTFRVSAENPPDSLTIACTEAI